MEGGGEVRRMKEHDVRQLLTIKTHGAKRELKKLSDDWAKKIRTDITVSQNDVDEFNEVAFKVSQLASEFERAFSEYQDAKRKMEEKTKMNSHKINTESALALRRLFGELNKGVYELERNNETITENELAFLNEEISVQKLIECMEEFIEITKK